MVKSKEDIKKYQKEYRERHKQERKNYDHIKYVENKSYFEEKNAQYYLDNKEDLQINRSIYYKSNKDSIKISHRIYIKNRRNNDACFNLRSQVSKNINRILKSQKSSKNNNSFLKYVEYSMEELKEHLEKQFESWMTWENWGIYDKTTWNDNDLSTWTWQIDHIVPQSKLLYSSMEDDNFKICWAFNNLRLLSEKQNLLEGNRK